VSVVHHSRARVLQAADVRARLDGLEIAVPASIGNLGSGFDALAVAVQLYLRIRVVRVLDDVRNQLRCTFDGVTLEGDDYVARSVRTLAAQEQLDYPALELVITSDIPMQAGLGSSAAATVAGLLLYDHMAGGQRDLVAPGTTLEGHPDNIAAALLGGLASGCVCDDGRVLVQSTPWPEEVRFVAVTPEARVKTPDARKVLPDSISRDDAVFNLQRLALLMQALAGHRHDLLREALKDRWHQPYREALVPGLAEALALDHPDLLGVCLSGSGPTIVALVVENAEGVTQAFTDLYTRLDVPCRVRVLAAHNSRQSRAGRDPSGPDRT
jgi:homoserine kinase